MTSRDAAIQIANHLQGIIDRDGLEKQLIQNEFVCIGQDKKGIAVVLASNSTPLRQLIFEIVESREVECQLSFYIGSGGESYASRTKKPVSGRKIRISNGCIGTIGLCLNKSQEIRMVSCKHLFRSSDRHDVLSIFDEKNNQIGLASQGGAAEPEEFFLTMLHRPIENSFVNSKGRKRKIRRCNTLPTSGMRVLGIGAMSSNSLGRIWLTSVCTLSNFRDLAPLRNGFIVVPNNSSDVFSLPGDSGAIVVTEIGREVLGMIVAGNIIGTLCVEYTNEHKDGFY